MALFGFTEKKIKQDIFKAVYPVGSIYISTVAGNPAARFGGTWVQIKDTFLLSAGDTYNAGATGGEAEHLLTSSEMPPHTHKIGVSSLKNTSGNVFCPPSGTIGTNASAGVPPTYGETSSAGGTAIHPNVYEAVAHNNMPPYLVVYVWKRTA